MVDFCNRLRNLRKGKGLTQAQVAELIGGTKAMISSYEMGTRYPPYNILIKFARLYGVSTDYLLGMTNYVKLDAEGLTQEQMTLVKSLIDELRNRNKA